MVDIEEITLTTTNPRQRVSLKIGIYLTQIKNKMFRFIVKVKSVVVLKNIYKMTKTHNENSSESVLKCFQLYNFYFVYIIFYPFLQVLVLYPYKVNQDSDPCDR